MSEEFDYGPIKSDGQYTNYPTKVGITYRAPIRNSYKHLKCGTVTTCGDGIAHTYATDPTYYSHTFCVYCRTHPPVGEFVWTVDNTPLGEAHGEPGMDLRGRR